MKNMFTSLAAIACMAALQSYAQETTEIKIVASIPPTSYHQVGLAAGFSNPNAATVDLFGKNGKDIVSIPNNYVGSQDADKGDNYLGIITYYETGSLSLAKAVESGLTEFNAQDAINYGEYIQMALPGNLTAGKEYDISFKVSLADDAGFSTSGWGMYFSDNQTAESTNKRLTVDPQLSFSGMITDKSGWTELKARYKATGNEKFAILGCFKKGYNTQKVSGGKGFAGGKAYYYVSSLAYTEVPQDRDHDGVLDKDDKCPDLAGVTSLAGCPDADNDGITDTDDECPKVAGVARFMGCPDTDNDGIPDSHDKCPNQAGVAANKGCPEAKMDLKVKDLFQKAMAGIQFETGKDVIKKTSFSILNNVADALKANPSWNTEVQGHTDNVGKPDSNKELSQKRANAVMKYLKEKGVTNTMTAMGYGMELPIADNKTAAGRAKNRRVEFKITYEK